MTNELRKALWNDFYGEFWGKQNWGVVRRLIYNLWSNFFHKLLDEAPKYDALWETIKTFYFSLEWHEVYDFIEFVANEYENGFYLDELIKAYNITLKRYLSAYRFIGKNLVKITSEQEIAEIEEALTVSKQFTPHLDQALTLLADRNVPDYRNSIKESISAVEAICQLIVDDENASLGKALTQLESKIGSFHKSFRNALNNLYGWTSDAQGIRHALLGDSDLDIEDARFMLIICSAFINYLAAKADKAGIEFSKS
jgi:hypothetical protein